MCQALRIWHGHWPPELLNSTIVSIPKDNRGSLGNSENYRGIALSNCICKIIDTVLLDKYSALLATSSLQTSRPSCVLVSLNSLRLLHQTFANGPIHLT